MAELELHGIGPEAAEGGSHPWLRGRVGRVIHLMGAAMSLALVAGLGLWGYKLLVRDVTGVPVIRTIEGPMRVQPEDPGGNRAAHQGLAVNRIAAVGDAAPPPQTILLAPRSADLEAEDMAQGMLRAAPELAAASAEAATEAPAPAAITDPVEAAILSATTEVMTAEAELSGEGLLAPIPVSVPGPARSPRPRQRPDGMVLASAAPEAPAAADEIDPATLPEGTKLVQFGAFDSAEEARAAWVALAGRFRTLMADKARVIEPATAGGRNFFRLRAVGFADAADARRFCAAFVAERADCIPVVAR